MIKENKDLKKMTGQYIAYNRHISGYSQEKLANLICISPRALSKIESGESLPSLVNATLIDKLLNISLMDFIKKDILNPELNINILYSEFLYYYEKRDIDKINSIFSQMINYSPYISKNSIQYKKYLFVSAWQSIFSMNYIKSYKLLIEAYQIKIPKSYESKELDLKIYILKESIAPDLEEDEISIDKRSIKSIDNLKKITIEMNDYPIMKLKCLYNILVINIENLENYSIDCKLLDNIIDLCISNNEVKLYYQCVFYRGIINFYNNSPVFHLDLDEALNYFFISNNDTFFNHNVKLMKNTILDKDK